MSLNPEIKPGIGSILSSVREFQYSPTFIAVGPRLQHLLYAYVYIYTVLRKLTNKILFLFTVPEMKNKEFVNYVFVSLHIAHSLNDQVFIITHVRRRSVSESQTTRSSRI